MTLLNRLAAAALISGGLLLSAQAYDRNTDRAA